VSLRGCQLAGERARRLSECYLITRAAIELVRDLAGSCNARRSSCPAMYASRQPARELSSHPTPHARALQACNLRALSRRSGALTTGAALACTATRGCDRTVLAMRCTHTRPTTLHAPAKLPPRSYTALGATALLLLASTESVAEPCRYIAKHQMCHVQSLSNQLGEAPHMRY
jgi:hypothetical protein